MFLIHADELIKEINENEFNWIDESDKSFLINLINRQPAYDIDKVMEELKEKYYSCDLESYEVDGSEYEDGRFDAYNDAIKIVKKGGAKLTSTTSVKLDNICDVCIFDEDECSEYRACCYNEYLREAGDQE